MRTRSSTEPKRRGWIRGAGAALVVVAAAGVVACEPTPAPSRRLDLSFAEASLPVGSAQSTATNRGSAPVRISVATRGGGRARTSTGRTGSSDRSLRFPKFDPTAPADGAVMSIVNAGSADRLDPGSARFEFGADFTIDATSADTSPASIDDGDNLVQRGRYEERSQYKLEIDHRQPICRIKGASGELTVFAGTKVSADRWYRARCVRDGNRVTVTVTSWDSGGRATSRSWSKTGPTGSMAPASATVPVSVGGKLWRGAVDPDADQYNGRLDNVVLLIG